MKSVLVVIGHFMEKATSLETSKPLHRKTPLIVNGIHTYNEQNMSLWEK